MTVYIAFLKKKKKAFIFALALVYELHLNKEHFYLLFIYFLIHSFCSIKTEMYQREKIMSDLKAIAVCVCVWDYRRIPLIYIYLHFISAPRFLFTNHSWHQRIFYITKQNSIITKQCHISWQKRHDYFRFGNNNN